MRIDSFTPARPGHDPVNMSIREKFDSRHLGTSSGVYDLYFVVGTVYVCRDGQVGVYTPQGEVFVRGREGKRMCEDFAKKYPLPNKDESA